MDILTVKQMPTKSKACPYGVNAVETVEDKFNTWHSKSLIILPKKHSASSFPCVTAKVA